MTTETDSEWAAHINREMNLGAFRQVQTFRLDNNLGPLPTDQQAQLDALLEEMREAKQEAEAKAEREELLLALLEAHHAKRKACREYGLLMPSMPEGWGEMLATCSEVVSLAAGRTPYMITVKLPEASRSGLAVGALLIIRFDHKAGPIDCALLDIESAPVRAILSPEKAVAEWQASRLQQTPSIH